MGQIFNEGDIVLRRGSPVWCCGLLGLQLTSDSQAFELPELGVAASQDVRVFVVATEASVTFGGAVSIGGVAGLTVRGSIDMLSFAAPAAVSGTLSIEGTVGPRIRRRSGRRSRERGDFAGGF